MTGALGVERPVMSSSEEIAFKNCRLAHHFAYDLGYAPVVTNRKLSVGIGTHEGLEVHYKGGSSEDVAARIAEWADARWQEILNAGLNADAMTRIEFIKDRSMVSHLVEGYIEWVHEEGMDDGYETVEVEEAHYIEMPGAETVMPVKLDLLQRKKSTGRLRIVDWKTRASFFTDTTAYQLSEQNGNYSLAVFAVYGEVPEELAYRELRKVNRGNGNSKPPFFREVSVRLTPEEMKHRAEEYARISAERVDPLRIVYANPGSCCGTWKNDWRSPCLLVHMGYTPEEALEQSTQFAPKNNYERYDDPQEDAGA